MKITLPLLLGMFLIACGGGGSTPIQQNSPFTGSWMSTTSHDTATVQTNGSFVISIADVNAGSPNIYTGTVMKSGSLTATVTNAINGGVTRQATGQMSLATSELTVSLATTEDGQPLNTNEVFTANP